MNYEARYQKLNKNQKQAVDSIYGPVMVVAGPGTGKTELLGMRVASILKKTDTAPESILCLTYTDSGAFAMRERLASIIGKDAYAVAIHTFHSFGSEVIGQNREFFYKGSDFQPADDIYRRQTINSLIAALPHDNPLASVGQNGEFIFVKDVESTVSEMRRAGIKPDQLREIAQNTLKSIDEIEKILLPILPPAGGRFGKKDIAIFEKVLPEFAKINEAEVIKGIKPYAKVFYEKMAMAVSDAVNENSQKPLTEIKQKLIEKDSDKNSVMKDRARTKKILAFSEIYEQYMQKLNEDRRYDFDSMVFDFLQALEDHPELLYKLQETYQFIMIDEFQDTNIAQMRITMKLLDSAINEGQPNIMVVGDDDQAIYSFQGAEISNIIQFNQYFPDVKHIALIDNYRSSAEVLKSSRNIITQNNERLETLLPNLSKDLQAHAFSEGKNPTPELHEFDNKEEEYNWIAKEIKAKIDAGKKPGDIAILSKKHEQLVEIAQFLNDKNIPVVYSGSSNILEDELIKLIEGLSKIVLSIATGNQKQTSSLMPEVLSHPAWGINSIDFWKLSVRAYSNNQSWLEVMITTNELKPLGEWLIECSQKAFHTPMEQMLDVLIGVEPDEYEGEKPSFISPIYEHFFGKNLEKSPARYIKNLRALVKLRQMMRDYRPHEEIFTIKDLVEYIDIRNDLDLKIKSSAEIGTEGVQLMSAHASKGLEFDTVFVINANGDVWGKKARGKNSNLSYPLNLVQLRNDGSYEERVRLFYVALTRAKHHLYVTRAMKKEDGKSLSPADFLGNESWEAITHEAEETQDKIIRQLETAWYTPITEVTSDLREILAPILENYKLSVTAINKFFDLKYGEPKKFLINELLKFPEATSPKSVYGTAFHDTLQAVHESVNSKGVLPKADEIKQSFESNLDPTRISNQDYQKLLEQGLKQTVEYIQSNPERFKKGQKTELPFARQGVKLEEAELTGNVDIATIDEEAKTIHIADYKTGKPAMKWATSDKSSDALKLHEYKRQLMFYEILVENSRDYRKYKFENSELIFVEPDKNTGKYYSLIANYTREELDHFKKLIVATWRAIQALDFPDVSEYKGTLEDVKKLEQFIIDKYY